MKKHNSTIRVRSTWSDGPSPNREDLHLRMVHVAEDRHGIHSPTFGCSQLIPFSSFFFFLPRVIALVNSFICHTSMILKFMYQAYTHCLTEVSTHVENRLPNLTCPLKYLGCPSPKYYFSTSRFHFRN